MSRIKGRCQPEKMATGSENSKMASRANSMYHSTDGVYTYNGTICINKEVKGIEAWRSAIVKMASIRNSFVIASTVRSDQRRKNRLFQTE